MLTFITIVHVLLCVFMIFVILLQPGKDAGMGAALGGGAATSAFGGRGAVTFLTKVTAICAVLFFLTSLGLSFVGLRTSVVSSLVEEPAKAAAKPPAGGTPIPATNVQPAPAHQAAPAGQATQPQPAPAIPTPQTLPAAPAPQATPTPQPTQVPAQAAPVAPAPKAAAPAAPAAPAPKAAPAGQPPAPTK